MGWLMSVVSPLPSGFIRNAPVLPITSTCCPSGEYAADGQVIPTLVNRFGVPPEIGTLYRSSGIECACATWMPSQA